MSLCRRDSTLGGNVHTLAASHVVANPMARSVLSLGAKALLQLPAERLVNEKLQNCEPQHGLNPREARNTCQADFAHRPPFFSRCRGRKLSPSVSVAGWDDSNRDAAQHDYRGGGTGPHGERLVEYEASDGSLERCDRLLNKCSRRSTSTGFDV
jgi:hypothetical protein